MGTDSQSYQGSRGAISRGNVVLEQSADEVSARARRLLWLGIFATLALYLVPFGSLVAYPLLLLSTLAHEMGHGVVGVLVGGHFDSFTMWANGSGVAHVHGYEGGVSRALVSAGGLVGPAVAAGFCFLLARRPKLARAALLVIAGLLVVSLATVIHGSFAVLFTALVVLALGYVGVRATAQRAQFALVFLAVQLSLSVFSRADYLFTDQARTGAGVMPSDVANMARALGGPYWLWGFLCGAASLVVLFVGVKLYLRGVSLSLPSFARRGVKGVLAPAAQGAARRTADSNRS